MININNKTDCCGCSACEQVCPKHCISMQKDYQGFNYPVIDKSNCINCNLCENVCPVINIFEPKEEPLKCFLSRTKNNVIRANSSSGGIFSELSKYVIEHGGVVFGVRFNNNWLAEYDYTETLEGLDFFRGSKYIQADVCSAFQKAQEYLKNGRLVLFSGTPCYIAGLNHFLRKPYENLLTLDIVCHSIPSPKIWNLYIVELIKKRKSKIEYITFRDKSKGWSEYSLAIDFIDDKGYNKSKFVESHYNNIFFQGFIEDIFTRPSCSNCPARNYRSHSDVTLADAWAINKYRPEQNDEKGISHVLLNTEKGMYFFEEILSNISYTQIPYEEVEPTKIHSPLTKSCKANPYRDFFYEIIEKGYSVSFSTKIVLLRYKCSKLYYRIINKIMKVIKLL